MCDWHRYVRKHLVVPGLKETRERDIIAEVASQLDDVYQEALARGQSEDLARKTAQAHIPNWSAFSHDLMKAERSRRRAMGDAWAEGASETVRRKGGGWVALADLIQDVRYSLRSLRASPGFSGVALLTLALGIGGVATIFTLYDQVLVRPLPYEDSEELVELWEDLASFGGAMVTYPNFLDWRDRNRTFEGMAAWNDGSVNVTGTGDPIEIDVLRVSSFAFPILSATPAMGRTFTQEEDRLGAPGVVVLSHTFWRDHLGSDSEALGTTLTFDENPFTVIGVMPREFYFPTRQTGIDAFVPIEQFAGDWIESRGVHPGILVLGRLLPEVTLETARLDLERIAVELEAEYPDTNEGSRINSGLLQERITRRAAEPLKILLAAVGLLLLIACINVANLVLARATSRQQEMAVRVSLGAGRQRILRLLLTESLVLWSLGGALGALIAVFGVRGVVTLLAEQIPPMFQVGLDLRIVGVMVTLSLATGLIFGLPPALRLVRQDLREHMKEGVRTTGGAGRARFRNGLVVAEVSLAVALLVGAGLTLRSYSKVATTSPGLDKENVLVVEVNLPGDRYAEEVQRTAFYTQLLDRVRALPGVEVAATSYNVPLGPGGWQNAFHVEGEPPEQGGQYTFSETNAVSTGYFESMGIPLLAGREFTRQDNLDAPRVMIVGQSMVDRYWPDEDPVGKRAKWGGYSSDNPWMEIIGVAGQVSVNGVTNASETFPQIYIPHWQDNDDGYYLMIKTRGEPLKLAEPVRRAVLTMDPAQPLASVGTMEGYASETTRGDQLLALLMAIFSVAAILLAGVGIYGVMSQMTVERRHEIRIRVALGAERDQVLAMVFKQGLATVAWGVVLGLGLAVVVGQLISSQLFQVRAFDPLTFLVTPFLVVAVAMAANLLPARRAANMDPVKALQAE
jgi:putative ABC transport system permease protein